MSGYNGLDLVTLKGVEREDLELLFRVADEMEKIVEARTRTNLLDDRILGLAFFQVSTRTRVSFESAMQRLGGGVVGFADPKTTRVGDYYAESLHDVMRMMESYADVIVIRHPQDGAPSQAAEFVDVPVISAGDGYNEHPTQSMLDAYAIYRERGTLDGLRIALVGDMNMRVMHSLPLALGQFRSELFFISPPEQSMPAPWLQEYDNLGLNYTQASALDGIIESLDVIYLMGTKTPSYAEGRTEGPIERPSTPLQYVMNREKLALAKPDLILLHPLPRTDELPVDVDMLPSARYFVQAHYGVALRMALLALIMGKMP